MLIDAKVENDKFIATHVQKVDDISRYCQDLAKDPSNGFTKDRLGRRIGSFPVLTLMDYDSKHEGWMNRVTVNNDFQDKQKAWKEFLASEWAKPFMMVEKMKH